MNCQEFWNTMPELAHHEDRSGHLRECPACTARLRGQRELEAGLRSVAEGWSAVQAPGHLEARLTAAFRAQTGPTLRPMSRAWVPAVTWMAAAASIAALALFLVRAHPLQTAHHRSPGRVEMAVMQAPSEAISYEDFSYNGADFIPLPNAAQITPNEDINLVRVEVPRSAMITLGYAVSADRASEPVQAEVMLGADGFPRAVRFLDE